MCLVPGLASGQYLLSNELLGEEQALEISAGGGRCGCGHVSSQALDKLSRRDLISRAGVGLAAAGLLGGGGLPAALGGPANASAASSPDPDRVVMLGLNGGPVLSKIHSQPALCLVVNGSKYLIDCGGDAARQLVDVGLNFSRVRHIFLTHQHLDHTAGYPEFALLGWSYQTAGPLNPGVKLWAPPPIETMHTHLKKMFALGTELFEAVGYPEWDPVIEPRQLSLPKHGIVKVMEDENVRVHATRVYHGPEIHDAYAYRFDVKRTGRSVVFSGDTVPNDQLIALAKDVDLLVHEAQMNKNIPVLLEHVAPSVRKRLDQHLHNSHTNVYAIPKIAKAAGAKRVSMCHYSLDPDPTNFLAAAQSAAAKEHYTGEILAPSELDQVYL